MASSKVVAAFEPFRNVSTDTRKIGQGDLFFALRGEQFDGNLFAGKALEAGAAYVVVDRPEVVVEGDERYLLVEDSLKALQDLALHYRRGFKVPVIGITGTNGKTTTKELLHAVLSTELKVHATAGNLNNHIGVPLTLLSMPTDIDVAIIEMGANKPGDIKELAEIAEPTHALITNIGQAHLERFINVEGVRRTKGELFDFIRTHGGTAFVNVHDTLVTSNAGGLGQMVRYGEVGADFYIQDLENHADHLVVRIYQASAKALHHYRSHLIGPHNAENILAAVTVGFSLGISEDGIRRGIKNYVPRLNRTELLQGSGFMVLLDAYNANPSSMAATLRGLAGRPSEKMGLILGDMFELGPESPRYHRELLELAFELFPDARIIGVGVEMDAALRAMGKGIGYAHIQAASEGVPQAVEGCDFLLVKGSRGMALERLLEPLGVKRDGGGH